MAQIYFARVNPVTPGQTVAVSLPFKARYIHFQPGNLTGSVHSLANFTISYQ